ncbi:traW domain protein [Escherichia coli 5-366-08_S4_C1]|nr:traW domain protein [Escherichia coli 5-366-08_S4_C1]
MASINTIVKRKQYLWLGIVVVGAASAIGGALYLSDVDMSGNGEAVAEQEPVPDMTGVVDTTFDDKVRQHATTEMQVTAAQMQKQYEEIRRELDVLNKQRGDDQRRIEKLGQDNAALAEQVKALGANPVTATGEPVPQTPASPPGPEGEPQPGNPPVSFPPQGSVAVPPPTAFYPGNGVTPPPQVFARQGEVMNPLQYVPFNQTLYFINGDDPAQVAWMKRQTPPTLESKIILVQGSIPEMQKALDSRIYFDQNGVLCQRLGIDQVPARVSAVPGARFLKVEFIPAEEGRK